MPVHHTATDRTEEFPAFREFWLVRPEPDAEEMTLLALVDGPSLAGAFEFRIRPGLATRVAVTAEIHARRAIRKLGLAPLSGSAGPHRARAVLTNHRQAELSGQRPHSYVPGGSRVLSARILPALTL